jgi:2-oxoglutarate dehydrogenase complex dehydrogenase (E1) component-like enzyme
MLRAVATRSPLSAFTTGSFQRVLSDEAVKSAEVRRVVLASGKVSLEAIARRDELGLGSVAVVRVEQLYPWPAESLRQVLAKYPAAEELVWLQEEPENMGAWPFLLRSPQWADLPLRNVARAESASPATGSSLVHAAEQADLLVRALQ